MRKLIAIALLLSVQTVQAQLSPGTSIFDLLTGEEIKEVTLRTDLVNLLSSTDQEASYQPATFSFTSGQGGAQTWDLKVKARGKFRRQVCDFPPLKLNFSKTALFNRGLADHDKLKLVTHCTDDKNVGNEKVMQEYLAYKLYQELNPYSYRVQLVSIQYIDDSGRLNGFRRLGFLIESTSELEARLNGEECEDCTYQPVTAFDTKASGMHAMFQYLIGNSDYSVPVMRNIKLIRRSVDGKLVPVGYDFDFAGFVDAPYAIPANHLGQITIRQRIYLGTLADDEEMQEILEVFLRKKEQLLKIIQDFRPLPSSKRFELKEYLLTFYDQIEMIESGGYKDVYSHLRQEHPLAIPDGGAAADYGLAARK
ncbi:hypothetical protein [Lewinella cohaerens]|uniref:hypothetical protein n=1 Tax=Lewinella cohaerens TaxID=70995 RepID=UPI000380CA18|nr:hypothetical protein [Lewinella cohaerens]